MIPSFKEANQVRLKVACATLLKVTYFHGCFPRFFKIVQMVVNRAKRLIFTRDFCYSAK